MFDADREHDFNEIVQDADTLHVRTLDDMEIEIRRNGTRWIARMYSPDHKYREVRGPRNPNPSHEDSERFFHTIVRSVEHADKWHSQWETRPNRKQEKDNRHDPPQTIAIILTLLPLATITITYVWTTTPFPHWLASLPWWTIIQTLPWFFAILACAPLGYLAVYAYRALAHWRLTVGEMLRAGVAATVGTTLCVLTLTAFFGCSNWLDRPLPARLTVAVAFVIVMLIVLYLLANAEYWPWRLLFPEHERLREQLAQSHADMEASVGDFWSYRDFGGLMLPIPLDVFPKWFASHLSDLEEYAAYHPQLLEELEKSKKRIEKHCDAD